MHWFRPMLLSLLWEILPNWFGRRHNGLLYTVQNCRAEVTWLYLRNEFTNVYVTYFRTVRIVLWSNYSNHDNKLPFSAVVFWWTFHNVAFYFRCYIFSVIQPKRWLDFLLQMCAWTSLSSRHYSPPLFMNYIRMLAIRIIWSHDLFPLILETGKVS